MNTKTSKNEVSIINHEVNYLINIVDNLKYSMIPDNYTWIYEEIIERINESSDNCINAKTILENIISEYHEEMSYNESLIAIWPEEARIGIHNRRKENQVIQFKITFINKALEWITRESEIMFAFFEVDLFEHGFSTLPNVLELNNKGFSTFDIIQSINEEDNITYALTMFVYLDYIPMLKEKYNAKNLNQLSNELRSWFQKDFSPDHIRLVLSFFESKNDDKPQYVKVMDRIIEKFGQNNCRVS
jgi:hypothetical protein